MRGAAVCDSVRPPTTYTQKRGGAAETQNRCIGARGWSGWCAASKLESLFIVRDATPLYVDVKDHVLELDHAVSGWELDGSGWEWMGVDGNGWEWMGVIGMDGNGWD